MKDFKLTDQDFEDIQAEMYTYKLGQIRKEKAMSRIEQIIQSRAVQDETGKDGTVEEILRRHTKIKDNRHWAYWYNCIDAMAEYAGIKVAEAVKEADDLLLKREHRIDELEASLSGCAAKVERLKVIGSEWANKIASLESDLTEAHKRIQELESERLKSTQSMRTKMAGECDRLTAELDKAENRVKELEGEVELHKKKEQTKLNTEMYRCNICGNTPSVIVFTEKGTFCKEHAKY